MRRLPAVRPPPRCRTLSPHSPPAAVTHAAATITPADVAQTHRHHRRRLDDGPGHAEPRARAHRAVRRRPVPELRAQAGWRQRHLVSAVSDHPPPARPRGLASGLRGRRRQRQRDFTRAARSVSGAVPTRPDAGAGSRGGRHAQRRGVGRFALEDKLVLYPLDFSKPIADNSTRLIRAIRLAGPKAVVHPLESRLRAPSRRGCLGPPRAERRRGGAPEPAGRRGRGLGGCRHPPGGEGRSRRRPRIAEAGLSGSPGALGQGVDRRYSVLSASTAPNTVGILRGSDPRLRNEYLVFSAHMDHIGITPGPAGQHQQRRR